MKNFYCLLITAFLLVLFCSCSQSSLESKETTSSTLAETMSETEFFIVDDEYYLYTEKNGYDNLTNSEKKAICQFIEDRYEYYDEINGGYAGDKYSDRIMQEAATKYGLTTTQIEIIWMNMYSY